MDPVHFPVVEPPAPEVPEPQHQDHQGHQHHQQHQEQLQNQYPEQYEQQQDLQQQDSQQDQPQSSEAETPTNNHVTSTVLEEATLPSTSYHNGYSSDSRAHYNYHTPTQDPQPQPPTTSRPNSGLSVTQKPPAQPTKNSVVIKVGMVGDAQIGKTSLMVKYVEGSWDEDYIQTLGTISLSLLGLSRILIFRRCQFHGKDHLDSKY